MAKNKSGVFSRTDKDGGRTWYIRYSTEGHRVKEKVGREKHGITEAMAKEALKSGQGDVVKGKFDLAKVKTFPLFSSLRTRPILSRPGRRHQRHHWPLLLSPGHPPGLPGRTHHG